MSTTSTSTFTITNAEYLASKIAADLKQMQALYNEPPDAQITSFAQELVVLLKGAYLSSMDYGFIKNGKWVLALSYSVNPLTGAFVDNNPGRVPAGKDISGAFFWSYRRLSQKYWDLAAEDRKKVDDSITLKRVSADDPQTGITGQYDKTYSSGGQQVNRKIIQ